MRLRGLKGIILLAASLLFLSWTNQAHSALLGIKADLDYPLIEFGKLTGTAISYKYQSKNFKVVARDMTMKLSESSGLIYLSGNDFETSLLIDLTLDLQGGKPVSGWGIMEEKVTKGSVLIGGKTYSQGTVLLSGTVYAFGWGESEHSLGSFDFKINNVTGALVSDGIWPPFGKDHRETGIYLRAENLKGWKGSWTKDFELSRVKGEKAPLGPPVPAPQTLILLGSGLGLVGILRRKRLK